MAPEDQHKSKVSKKKTWAIAFAVLGVALFVGGLLGAKPWARGRLVALGRERGLVVEFQELELGPSRILVRGLSVRPERSDSIQAELHEVRFDVSFWRRELTGVFVDGGRVRLRGNLAKIQEDWAEFRQRQTQGSTRQGGSSKRTDVVRGVSLEWDGIQDQGDRLELSSLSMERGPGGARIGADWASLKSKTALLRLAGIEATLGPRGLGEWKEASLAEAELDLDAEEVSEPDRGASQVGPGASGGKNPQGESANSADAPWLGLLALDPQRPEALRRILHELRAGAGSVPPRAQLKKWSIRYRRSEKPLHLGPFSASLEKKSSELSLSVTSSAVSAGPAFALSVTLPLAEGEGLKAALSGGPVPLTALGLKEGDLGLLGLGNTSIDGKVTMDILPGSEEMKAKGRVSLEGLTLQHDGLGSEPARLSTLLVEGEILQKVNGSVSEVERVEMALGEARARGRLKLERAESSFRVDLGWSLPLSSCQALLDSLPRAWLGPAVALRLDGTLKLDLRALVDTKELKGLSVKFDFDNQCRVTETSPGLHPDRFREAFEREVPLEGGGLILRQFGPLTAGWTSLGEIPDWFQKALLVTEDGRFHSHRGFDVRAMESAIGDNLKAGRFVRGASTLSMQLAKNLYLSRDKTLSRKIQEALYTMALEQTYKKEELIELYANVVELGPNVYGIREAAQYYFRKPPSELSVAQCFFLASILPAPTATYFDADSRLKAKRKAHLHRLLDIALARKLLLPSEVQVAQAEELIFGVSDSRGSAPSVPAPTSASPTPLPGEAAPSHEVTPHTPDAPRPPTPPEPPTPPIAPSP